MTLTARPAWEAALLAWLRSAVAPFDTPAPTPPALTPVAHTIQAIYADQDAPRPKPPYVSLQCLADLPQGIGSPMSYDTASGDTITREDVEWRTGTISVGVYGVGHAQLADEIALSLEDEAIKEALRAATVVIVGEEGRQRIGLTSGKVPEDRTVIDFRYTRAASRTRTITNTIGHVPTTLQFINRTIDENAGDFDDEAVGSPIVITLPPEE